MTGHLNDTDLRRMTRGGLVPLSSVDGIVLFDAANALGEAVVVPAKLDTTVLRAQPESVPRLLRGLVRAAPRRGVAEGSEEGPSSLAQRLVRSPRPERDRVLLELVRGQTATVLGHADRDTVRQDSAFTELGFDSLTAVELRNRLNATTGLRLSPTLVFDYPTPARLVDHLRERLVPDDPPTTDPADGTVGEGPTGHDLESATDEELFAFVDEGLG